MVVYVRNEKGGEVARHVINVGALAKSEERTVSLSVDVMPPRPIVPVQKAVPAQPGAPANRPAAAAPTASAPAAPPPPPGQPLRPPRPSSRHPDRAIPTPVLVAIDVRFPPPAPRGRPPKNVSRRD